MRPRERRLRGIRPSQLAGRQDVERIADDARDGEKNDRLKRACSRARRDHDAEKSERDRNHPFRAYSFAQHRTGEKSHEDRREKRNCRSLGQLELADGEDVRGGRTKEQDRAQEL